MITVRRCVVLLFFAAAAVACSQPGTNKPSGTGGGGAAGSSGLGGASGAGSGGTGTAGDGGGGANGAGTGGASAVAGQSGTGGATAGAAGAGGGAGIGGPICNGFRIPEDHPNAARDYDTGVAGVVTDAVTGLMWERTVAGSGAQWNSSAASCAAKNVAGLSGWRLPSRLELASVVDFAVQNPAIHAVTFPNTPTTWFATSSEVYQDGRTVGGLDYGWTIDFKTGLTMNGKPPTGFVRCVRTAAPRLCHPAGARYSPSPSAVVMSVVDNATLLTWQKESPSEVFDWDGAKAYCAARGGGYRLPGAKELLSLTDLVVVGVAIDRTAFPNTPADEFWTSTPVAGMPTSALAVNFSASVNAGTVVVPVTQTRHVRCVRSP